MADLYVRSTDGSDSDNGTTWDLAKATLVGVSAIDSAGDRLFISQAHAESTASTITFSLAGTLTSPSYILCGNDAATPPTALATTASITTTATSNINFAGNAFYVYGLVLNGGSGTGAVTIAASSSTASARTIFEKCVFNIVATGAGRVEALAASAGVNTWINCDVKFSAAGQGLRLGSPGVFNWNGGSVLAGGTSPTTLLTLATSGGRYVFSGIDLSNCSSSLNLVTFSSGGRGIFRNCKLPASWSGSFVTGTLTAGERHEMHNCDSGDTNYRLWIEEYAGSIKTETTIVRTGGATDGTTPFSWKFVSNASARYPHAPLASPELAVWNNVTGSPVTLTVEVVTDNVTLTDAECWLEVQYLGTSGAPLSSFISDTKADILATAASQDTSTETWTTTGLTTPVKQKLAVTFTPQEAGYIQAVVKLAKASTTLYVDPKLTVV